MGYNGNKLPGANYVEQAILGGLGVTSWLWEREVLGSNPGRGVLALSLNPHFCLYTLLFTGIHGMG